MTTEARTTSAPTPRWAGGSWISPHLAAVPLGRPSDLLSGGQGREPLFWGQGARSVRTG